jgi:hypothetical protein
MNTQSGSQWDGFRHFGHLGIQKLYNNLDPKDVVSGPFPTPISGDEDIPNWMALLQVLAVVFRPSLSMGLPLAEFCWIITPGLRSMDAHMTHSVAMQSHHLSWSKSRKSKM